MSRDSNGRDRRTRRAYLGASGALLGGTILAGCTGDGAAPGTTDAPTETDGNTDGATPTETPTASEAAAATTDDGDLYPEIPESEWLFDRERVAAIVNGTS